MYHVTGLGEFSSERNNIRQQLEPEASTDQSKHLASVARRMAELAHESRNALQRAQSNLELLTLELGEQPNLLDLTQRTQRALSDIHRLFKEMRSTALSQRHIHHVDVLQLCENVWTDLSVSHPDKPIHFVESVRCADTCCDIDDTRVSQVFRNVFENAIFACPNPGRIEIECGNTEIGSKSALEVCIRDNGHGLPEGSSDRIFEPFFTTKPSGTGLGMAIAKQIVADHGGQMTARNSSDTGAEVVVTLPRHFCR
jgi:signal transduction histidine kinase